MKLGIMVGTLVIATICVHAGAGPKVPFLGSQQPHLLTTAASSVVMTTGEYEGNNRDARTVDTTSQKMKSKAVRERDEKYLATLIYPNRFFFAVGYGYPMGGRLEVGYNASAYISLGLAAGFMDSWSSTSSSDSPSGEGSIAAIGRLHIPVATLSFVPYISVCSGAEVATLREPNRYTTICLGGLMPIGARAHFRPEVGVAMTSTYISGGKVFFIPTTPVVRHDVSRFQMGFSLEVDL